MKYFCLSNSESTCISNAKWKAILQVKNLCIGYCSRNISKNRDHVEMFYTSPFPFSPRQNDWCWHPSHLAWACLKSLILIFILCTWYKNSKKITTAEIEWDPKIRPSQPYCGIFIDIPSANFPALCNIHTYIQKDFLLSLKIHMYYFCFCQFGYWQNRDLCLKMETISCLHSQIC